MHARRDFLLLRYWYKVVRMEETRITKKVYRVTREKVLHDYNKENKCLWVNSVKEILEDIGLQSVWKGESLPSKREWDKLIKAKLHQREQLQWLNQMKMMPKLRTYVNLKTELKCERYLYIPISKEKRSMISQLRTGTNSLRVETGRWEHLAPNDRLCPMCELESETEAHFLLRCPAYDNSRQDLINKIETITKGAVRIGYMKSDIAKLDLLIGRGRIDENYEQVYMVVANFIKHCFEFRNSLMFGEINY